MAFLGASQRQHICSGYIGRVVLVAQGRVLMTPASICWTTAEADLVVGIIPLHSFEESPACLQVMLNAMYVSIWIG